MNYDKGPSRPAVGKFPYPGHRNMQQVIEDRERWKEQYREERASWRR